MFDRTTLAEVGSFLAFAPAFQGGVTVALADLDGDGRSDLIAGAGPGAAPHVRVFGLDGTEKASFLADDAGFRGGVVVAAGDTDGDGRAEVLTGAGAGGGPHVRVFGIDGVARASFMASDAQGHGGIHIAGAPVSTADRAPSASDPIIESLAGGANPFETLTIRGRFLAGVPATVIFDDGKGFRVEVPAEESAPGVLTVPVPPHFDAATNKLTVASTTVRVTVEQGGRKSAAKSLVVAGIPESAAPAGKLTKSWSDELYKFAVEEGSLSAADLASWKRFNDVLAELVSGAKDSVDLAARGLGSGVLRRSDLATMDRLLAAAVVANISPVLSASSIEALSDGDGTVPSRHRSLSMASVSALPSNTAGIRSNGVQPVTPLSPGRAIVQGGVTVLLGVVQ